MPDWVIHAATSGIGLVAAAIGLYVSYRLLLLKEWFRSEMTTVVRENCAGKAEFNAHVAADQVFQENILATMEKNEEVADEILQAKFETVRAQVATVGERVDGLTRLVDQRLRYPTK